VRFRPVLTIAAAALLLYGSRLGYSPAPQRAVDAGGVPGGGRAVS
jgi:hypothetical protein